MSIIDKVREDMAQQASVETAKTMSRFFKKNEKLKFYGLKSEQVRKIAKQYKSDFSVFSKEKVFDIAETFLSSGIMEEGFLACHWLKDIKKSYVGSDFAIFETWIDQYIDNWATCDTICSSVLGEFLLKFPEYVPKLKEWAVSENMWMKRSAAVSLILPLRRKQPYIDIAFEIADILLLDNNDLVQKGYGWMLKVASDHHQKEVFNYVVKHKKVMPRTALRYAIEKMPKELRIEALKK